MVSPFPLWDARTPVIPFPATLKHLQHLAMITQEQLTITFGVLHPEVDIIVLGEV